MGNRGGGVGGVSLVGCRAQARPHLSLQAPARDSLRGPNAGVRTPTQTQIHSPQFKCHFTAEPIAAVGLKGQEERMNVKTL